MTVRELIHTLEEQKAELQKEVNKLKEELEYMSSAKENVEKQLSDIYLENVSLKEELETLKNAEVVKAKRTRKKKEELEEE